MFQNIKSEMSGLANIKFSPIHDVGQLFTGNDP